METLHGVKRVITSKADLENPECQQELHQLFGF